MRFKIVDVSSRAHGSRFVVWDALEHEYLPYTWSTRDGVRYGWQLWEALFR